MKSVGRAGGVRVAGSRCSVLVLAAVLLATAACPARAGRIEVVADGRSAYVIAVSESAPRTMIQEAAQLLQSCIAEATGVTLPIVQESAVPAGAPAFYLGDTRKAAAAGVPVEKAQDWNALNRVVGRDIFLLGQDGRAPITDRAIQYRGTLKAVIVFLEDQAGVRFILPGRFGTFVPKMERFVVSADLDIYRTPLFEFVAGRSPRDPVYPVAINLNGHTPAVRTYGGHSYYTAVPAKEYGESNPEYFALIGGVRTPAGNHLCISNPDVQELMLKEMQDRLDDGYRMVELAQTDGYQPCRCDECEALHPRIGERIWIVHRELAEEMLRRRPEGRVMLLQYADTVNPPESFSAFPPNVVIQMTKAAPEHMEMWAPFQVPKAVYEIYWGQWGPTGYAPSRTPRFAVNQVRFLRENQVIGIVVAGGFISGQGAFTLDGPSYYAFGKALEDPDLDPDAVLEEYLRAAFGDAVAPMRAFFRGMFDRLELTSVFGSRRHLPTGYIHNALGTPEDFFCHVFPPKLLGEMHNNLQRAMAMAGEERVLAHLRLLEIEFENIRTLAHVYHLYRAYRALPSRALLDALANSIEARRAWVDFIYPPEGSPVRIEGMPPPFIGAGRNQFLAAGRGRFVNNPPFNWDFAMFREQNVLPGAMPPKRMDIVRVDPITIDGRIDRAPWQDIAFQEMQEISLGGGANPSRFKAAYDHEAFYVAIEFEYDDEAWLDRLRPMGRDGNAWAQECVEILIDPFGMREKHVQLVFNPIEDSMYDARANYITDEEHPLYGRRDDTWRGDWAYAARIDREGKRWTAEARIPFATLEVDPPAPGTLWTLNIARAEWPIPREQGGIPHVRFSTWSPNLESRSFHDRSSYGEAVFR